MCQIPRAVFTAVGAPGNQNMEALIISVKINLSYDNSFLVDTTMINDGLMFG
jgi:hypothetical protein